MNSKKLVLAGAGHAHMTCLANLGRFVEKGFRVTVIGSDDHHYYSGMGPGMLGDFYRPEEIRFATRRVVEKFGGVFVEAKVVRIDPVLQSVFLQNGDEITYDVLSCNLGSHVADDIVMGGDEDIFLAKPIDRLLLAKQRILELAAQKRVDIGIIGGGPSAVEIAGNVWNLTRRPGVLPADVKVLSGTSLMPRHPAGIRRKAIHSLQKRGIAVIENRMVKEVRNGGVVDASGSRIGFDIIFVAVGVKPTPVFAQSGIPTGPDGGMRVNRFLHSPGYANLFGGGDCIYFEDSPLDKVGVYAVRQNPVLYHNLMAALEGRALKPFKPDGGYLLIFNLGDGTGIFRKWRILFNGRLAFKIKDYIDRRFMRIYQAAEH